MKTLIRTLLFLFVFLLLVVGIGLFVVTREGFQKKLVESQLPTGSSIEYVKLGMGSLEMTDLHLALEDGTTAKLASLRSDFSPMAAIFDNTIVLRGLTVDGLLVEMPETLASSANPEAPAPATKPTEAANPSEPSEPSEATQAGATADESPFDALYALGELDVLFDIDSININGALLDAARNRYNLDVKSDPIEPGKNTTLTVTFKLESKQALQGGLKDFSSDARLIFTQKQSGGFEQLRVESQTAGRDVNGGSLLSISQTLALAINSSEKTADISLSFNADMPRPEVFAAELIALQGLSLQGEFKASAHGDALTLQTADLTAASNESQVASVKLKQALTLGAEQKFAGELMQVNLIKLPITWLNPWLGDGMLLSGEPISTQLILSGETSGALEVKMLAPLQIGAFSFSQNEQALLQDVTVRINPVIRVEPDQTIRFGLGDLQILDRYGVILSGTVSGSKSESEVASPLSPLAGLQVKAMINLGLAELLQQPVLTGIGSVLAGQFKIDLKVDGDAETPLKLQTEMTGLRARDLPGSQLDFRLSATLNQVDVASYTLSSSFRAGSKSKPSTSFRMTGEVDLDQQPIPFKVNLAGKRVLQADIDLLMAALKTEAATTNDSGTPTASAPEANGGNSPADSASSQPVTARPPWADLDGEVTIQFDEITLQTGHKLTGVNAEAIISEALLSLSELAASLEGGEFGGNAKVAFDADAKKAYQLSSSLNFKDFDPAIFSKKASGSFPVQGLFDGELNLSGSGATLEQAVEDSEADLLVTGREGVLTAFELDERSQLGLLGAGILGQSLKRPGMTAMAEAIPYFKDMEFSNFTLQLSREQDKKVRIPELKFVGDNLLINGTGIIAASSLSDVLDQPLELTLGFGAKGKLIDYLDTLQLLSSETNEDGFRSWNKDIDIGGTLGSPDTSGLKDILSDAALRALNNSGDSSGGLVIPGLNLNSEKKEDATEDQEKSKDEKRRDDVEMGLDLLNSVFG